MVVYSWKFFSEFIIEHTILYFKISWKEKKLTIRKNFCKENKCKFKTIKYVAKNEKICQLTLVSAEYLVQVKINSFSALI